MIDANKVKETLNMRDIASLLQELGGECEEHPSELVSRTICHNPAHTGKHKLIYYNDTHSFRCYTGCGSMDIYGLISRIYGYDFYESFLYICKKFNIQHTERVSISSDPNSVDMGFFDKFKKEIEFVKCKRISESVLRSYDKLYHEKWIKEGINIESMKKFGIMYSIMDNQIIIPHRDKNGRLIGVRARNLNKDLVDKGKKYMPVYHKGSVLKHPTGSALYGLDKTKKDIRKYHRIILFESEKSVLQLDSFKNQPSIGVAISGSNLTYQQIELLKDLEIDEVIIALDKEFNEIGDSLEKYYASKIEQSFASKLKAFFQVSVIWDVDGKLNLKDSPTDHGEEIFSDLLENRIFL